MKKHIKWLIAEIDQWVKDRIIEPHQAQAIKTRYPSPEHGPAWGRIIFFSIGAILLGLGVILLFAYNWQRMRFDFEFATERCLVVADGQIRQIGTLEGSEQFRLVYRPPDEAASSHLHQKDIIWHGYVASRVFHGRG